MAASVYAWARSPLLRKLIEDEIERLIAALDFLDMVTGADAEDDDPPEDADNGIADSGALEEVEAEQCFARRFQTRRARAESIIRKHGALPPVEKRGA